jgi:hypothetical protein
MIQDHRIGRAQQRLVICRALFDIFRTMHEAYVPPSEPFGTRLETGFIGLCVALGDYEDRPFSVSKIAAYMHVPRTTVIRRLDRLQRWGVIGRRGHRYYLNEKKLNSIVGMGSYGRVRLILSRATEELSALDKLQTGTGSLRHERKVITR